MPVNLSIKHLHYSELIAITNRILSKCTNNGRVVRQEKLARSSR